MNTCKQEFVNQGCMCLADPMDPWSTICGYINKQNGLVYPCDEGCCVPKCDHMGHAPRVGIETRRSAGTDLPPGFNVNLPQSDEPTPIKGATPLDQLPKATDPTMRGDEPVPSGQKVWQIVLKSLLIFLVIFLAAISLD